MTGWDNTARRKSGTVIFTESTPDLYESWLRHTIETNSPQRSEEDFLFVMAWNEWAEGNHLEPDELYGRGYLEATARALGILSPEEKATENGAGGEPDKAESLGSDPRYAYEYDYVAESTIGHIVALARDFVEEGRTIVDLGAGAAVSGRPLGEAGFVYRGMDSHPEALRSMREAGIDAGKCDLADPAGVAEILDGLEGGVGGLLLIDVL
jgi:ribosomal protein L11 methylase PrmA